MPAQPLPGSIATASTLAFALVHKYVDGTPLYRLAQTFERAGVPVSHGALGHWVIGSSEKHLSRIYDALKLQLRSQPLIHGDETTVQVLKEKDREATSASYMWAYRSGEDSDEPERIYVDKGYRGHDYKGPATVFIAGNRRGLTPTIRRELRRRSAIEATIGHMKTDGRLDRNFLSGHDGYAISAMLVAAAHNLRLILSPFGCLYSRCHPQRRSQNRINKYFATILRP